MEEVNVVRDFYENGAEVGRLEQGLGIVEATRTNELLSRYVRPGMTVYDVGGGVGYYSDWLVGMGCDVTMFKLAPSAVEYAKGHCAHSFPVYAADARELPATDASCDVVLLMGPLYHLLEKESRMQAAWGDLPGALSWRIAFSCGDFQFFGSRAEEMTASKRTAVTLSFCYSFREFVFMGAWLRLLADCRAPRRAGELAGILRTELAPSGTRGAFYSVAKEFRLVIRDELSAPLLYS